MPAPTGPVVGAATSWLSQEHRYDIDQPAVLDVHRGFRRVAEPYGALLLGEVYLPDARLVARYVDAQDGLHASFLFTTVGLPMGPGAARCAAARGDGSLTSPGVGAVEPRQPARVSCFGGGRTGQERALLVHTVLAGLPGLPFHACSSPPAPATFALPQEPASRTSWSVVFGTHRTELRGLDRADLVWGRRLYPVDRARAVLGYAPRYFSAFPDGLRRDDPSHYRYAGEPWWGAERPTST